MAPGARPVRGSELVNRTTASGVAIAYQVTGSGEPATCFVPGMTQSIADVRPFGSGVVGSRAFLDLRAHGASESPVIDQPDAWTYGALADDVTAVADEVGAHRGVGVSLGAGALLTCVVRDPSRWDRLVLALPADVDELRDLDVTATGSSLADAIESNDPIEIGRLLLLLQPSSVRNRTLVKLWARRHAAEIGGTPVAQMLRELADQTPVDAMEQLAAFEGRVLVLAQRDDPAHQVAVAERLSEAFTHAQLVVSDKPWIWSARDRLREVVSEFLNE